MLNRFKSALYNVVGSFEVAEGTPAASSSQVINQPNRQNGFPKDRALRYSYCRPEFLQLISDEEIIVTADQTIRPIICPRDNGALPWNVGYAETINAGKSKRNEDQSAYHRGCLHKVIPGWVHSVATLGIECQNMDAPEGTMCSIDAEGNLIVQLPYYYFGVFDGHAGWGAAVAASKELHNIIHDKLMESLDLILPNLITTDQRKTASGPLWYMEKVVTPESAVVGALERAFVAMDSQIAEDRFRYQLSGGCTACIGLFILGKLFVANAGDSRAILCKDESPYPMSFDFTPESEIQRIKKLGAMQPELMGGEFTHMEFLRRPMRRDLGKKAAFRDHYMTGWGYKTISHEDLKYPLVCGEGKRSRVMATIGVTRGFGDHDLRAQNCGMPIKPFLSAEPEVRVFDLTSHQLLDSDVLILATDGLWDITTNDVAVQSVCSSIKHFPATDLHRHKYRYMTAAQDLVMCSRGKMKLHHWRTAQDKHATIDDITVMVVPLQPYKEEYEQWNTHFQYLLSQQAADHSVKEDCDNSVNGVTDHFNDTVNKKSETACSSSDNTVKQTLETINDNPDSAVELSAESVSGNPVDTINGLLQSVSKKAGGTDNDDIEKDDL